MHKTVLLAWQFPFHFKVAPSIFFFFNITNPQGENKKTKVQIARQLMGLPKVMGLLLGGVAGGYVTPDTRPPDIQGSVLCRVFCCFSSNEGQTELINM